MKITPIEIRQHTFQKTLRGYDTEEVTAFLTSLSNEWERVLNENKMLKMQLEIAEKELNKLREVELTMFRMLKNAEDTSTQMTEQAQIAAETYINEARQKSEEVINEARQKSQEFINESRKKGNMLLIDAENQAKYVRDEIMGEFKNYERDFKAIEKYRDNLLVQLKTLANNTTDSIERFEKKFSNNTFKEKFDELKNQVSATVKANEESLKSRTAPEEVEEEDSQPVDNKPQDENEENKEQVLAQQYIASAIVLETNLMENIIAESTDTATKEDIASNDVESIPSVDDTNSTLSEEENKDQKGSFFDNI